MFNVFIFYDSLFSLNYFALYIINTILRIIVSIKELLKLNIQLKIYYINANATYLSLTNKIINSFKTSVCETKNILYRL